MRRHNPPVTRRRLLLAAASMAFMAFTLTPGEATSPPAPGSVSEGSPAPNMGAAADDRYNQIHASGGATQPSMDTYSVVDGANGVLVETNQLGAQGLSQCPAQPTGPYVPKDDGVDWASYDLNTYRLIAYGCGLPAIHGQQANFTQPWDPNVAVVAPSLGAVMVPCRRCEDLPGVGNSAPSDIAFVSERTLTTVAWLCAAPGDDPTFVGPQKCTTADGGNSSNAPYRYLHDISWDAAANDVVAITDNFSAAQYPTNADPIPIEGSAGVAVTDYHVSVDPRGHLSFTLRWTEYLAPPLCTRALSNVYNYTAAAYRSEKPGEQNLFVPCQARLLGCGATCNPSPDPHTAIVKVPLRDDCQCPTSDALPLGAALSNPNGSVHATIAPLDGQAWLFDPVAERGYLLPPSSTEGFTISVYDGTGNGPGAFIGRINAASGGGLSFGMDSTTGRLYLDDSVGTGLMIVDGRRTPIEPGRPFPAIGRSPYGPAFNTLAPVAPADAAHPYARVFESLINGYDPASGRSSMRTLTVIEDAVPVSQDPPANQVDQNTYSGAVPPGAAVSTATYTGHAAGYGFHSDLVGGYGGIPLNDVFGFTFVPPPPYDTKTIDTAAAVVEDSTARDGVTHGTATAFADVNGNATQIYGACSDMFSPQGCSPVNCANPVVDPSSPAHDPCGAALAALASGGPQQSTKQAWPYPEAACSRSGSDDKNAPQQQVSGMEYTPEHSTAPSAMPAPQTSVPSSDQSGARAAVDCRNLQSVSSAQYQCAGGTLPPAPAGAPSAVPGAPDLSPSGCDGDGKQGQVTVLGGLTTTQVQSPTATTPKTYVSVTASAYGIHIALPDGSQLDIKQAQQIVTATAGGLPGTAHTTRQVVVSGVVSTKPGQQPDVLCAGSCTGSSTLLDALNGLDPAHLYITFPDPDDQFGREKDGVSPLGSPGGYLATVQASPAQQGGDERWNAMTGFGGTEKALLPAMRIVIYNSGDTEVSREVLDLAGVEADASLGVQVASNDDGTTTTPTIENTQGMIAAGVPTGDFNGGNGGSMNLPGQPPAPVYHTGLQGVLERALDGLRWLLRSPFGGIQMAAFLVMLGLPVMLLRRRWLSGPRV